MSDLVICPECAAVVEKSTVREGYGSTTDMYFAPFYDEEGRRHHHDGNATSLSFECSRGHSWMGIQRGSCWCGWGK